MSLHAQKQALRQKLLQQRQSIPESEFLEKSAQICSRLKATDLFQKAEVVHCYISMNQRGEVNTHPLVKETVSEKKMVVPVTEFDSGTLRHIHLEKFDQLAENKWGVLEPEKGEEVPVQELELVLVPMVGGDHQKNRIGYGEGFYDRFLSTVNCPTVGLLFEDCLVDSLPVEPFDVPLSLLITEKQIIG